MNLEIQERLRSCPNLPTLSSVALRIVELGHSPEFDLGEVARLLSNDPALAAKILRVANSSLYQQRRKAHNLREALTLLGLKATVTIALGFSLAACFREVGERGIDFEKFWRRALLSGLASRLLGEELGMRSLEELLLAGLLQDVGMLALDAAFASRYASAVEGVTEHETLVARERKWVGADHCEVGAWLMREWKLPEYLPLAALASHDLGHSRVPAELVSFVGCVAVSGRLADIFLVPEVEIENTTATAAVAADTCLGMDGPVLSKVLTRMTESLPEIEALFQVPVLSAKQIVAITDQARELLAARNLQLLQLAEEARCKEAEFHRISQHLHEMARRDALTGVFNRRHFDESLTKEFALASELRWPLSVAYLDLDHFKAINDRYGHTVGDTVLKAVAQKMQAGLRQDDVLARYGGEEFVLLLTGIGLAAAHMAIDRLRASVEVLDHRLASGEVFHVTLSAGIAAHMDNGRCFEQPADLMQAADHALYLAKRNGRNRVELAG